MEFLLNNVSEKIVPFQMTLPPKTNKFEIPIPSTMGHYIKNEILRGSNVEIAVQSMEILPNYKDVNVINEIGFPKQINEMRKRYADIISSHYWEYHSSKKADLVERGDALSTLSSTSTATPNAVSDPKSNCNRQHLIYPTFVSLAGIVGHLNMPSETIMKEENTMNKVCHNKDFTFRSIGSKLVESMTYTDSVECSIGLEQLKNKCLTKYIHFPNSNKRVTSLSNFVHSFNLSQANQNRHSFICLIDFYDIRFKSCDDAYRDISEHIMLNENGENVNRTNIENGNDNGNNTYSNYFSKLDHNEIRKHVSMYVYDYYHNSPDIDIERDGPQAIMDKMYVNYLPQGYDHILKNVVKYRIPTNPEVYPYIRLRLIVAPNIRLRLTNMEFFKNVLGLPEEHNAYIPNMKDDKKGGHITNLGTLYNWDRNNSNVSIVSSVSQSNSMYNVNTNNNSNSEYNNGKKKSNSNTNGNFNSSATENSVDVREKLPKKVFRQQPPLKVRKVVTAHKTASSIIIPNSMTMKTIATVISPDISSSVNNNSENASSVTSSETNPLLIRERMKSDVHYIPLFGSQMFKSNITVQGTSCGNVHFEESPSIMVIVGTRSPKHDEVLNARNIIEALLITSFDNYTFKQDIDLTFSELNDVREIVNKVNEFLQYPRKLLHQNVKFKIQHDVSKSGCVNHSNVDSTNSNHNGRSEGYVYFFCPIITSLKATLQLNRSIANLIGLQNSLITLSECPKEIKSPLKRYVIQTSDALSTYNAIYARSMEQPDPLFIPWQTQMHSRKSILPSKGKILCRLVCSHFGLHNGVSIVGLKSENHKDSLKSFPETMQFNKVTLNNDDVKYITINLATLSGLNEWDDFGVSFPLEISGELYVHISTAGIYT